MSQPQLTKFFGTTKRGTRASGKASLQKKGLVTRKSSRGKNVSVEAIEGVKDAKIVLDEVAKAPVQLSVVPSKPSKQGQEEEKEGTVDKENTARDENVCPSPVKRPRKSSRSESSNGEVAQPPRRVSSRSKVKEIVEEEAPASPAKRAKRGSSKRSETVDEAIELAKNKLTPAQVKSQLTGIKGRNKLAVLREQLKTIQENSKTAEQQAAEAAAKKAAAEKKKASVEERAAREATPAHKAFHSLTAKDDGTLPLPFTYSFLAEVFRCTETIAAMLHNRQEVITVEKLKKGVETMTRKNFQLDFLKRIRTVFPSAYLYIWEQMVGKYGKKLNEYELRIGVNMDFRRETLLAGGGDATDEAKVVRGKLNPTGVVERRNIFRNSLVAIVKTHHMEFCKGIGIDLTKEGEVKKFHPDFQVDKVPEVPITELPPKPDLEKYQSAKDMLEAARDLFEAAPKVATALEQAAINSEGGGTKKEGGGEIKEAGNDEAEVKKTVVPKALTGVSMSLIEKIRAKEREKKAREMYQNKDEEIRMKRLQRLPETARYVKSIFISEQRNALKQPFLLQKVYQSYPGWIDKDTLSLDLDKLAEVSAPWMTMRTIQKEVWVMLNKDTDVNLVVKMLEEKAK